MAQCVNEGDQHDHAEQGPHEVQPEAVGSQIA